MHIVTHPTSRPQHARRRCVEAGRDVCRVGRVNVRGIDGQRVRRRTVPARTRVRDGGGECMQNELYRGEKQANEPCWLCASP